VSLAEALTSMPWVRVISPCQEGEGVPVSVYFSLIPLNGETLCVLN
jgi:hypothetical protein